MAFPRMMRGSLAARLSTLPAKVAAECAKLEGVTVTAGTRTKAPALTSQQYAAHEAGLPYLPPLQ